MRAIAHTARDAWGGAKHALICAREEKDPDERARWIADAMNWRKLAKWLRSKGRKR